MSNTNTGGPAFPCVITGPCEEFGLKADETQQLEFVGMTLRDYFAAKALQGFIGTIFEEDMNFDQVANFVYGYADAMLKAREQ